MTAQAHDTITARPTRRADAGAARRADAGRARRADAGKVRLSQRDIRDLPGSAFIPEPAR